MISPLDVAVLDENSVHLGVEVSSLMENAGSALAGEIAKRAMGKNRVLFVLGTGNNGGDGFVAARHLKGFSDCKPVVFLVGDPGGIRTDISRSAYSSLPKDVPFHSGTGENGLKKLGELLKAADVIVDGLLGSGAEGAPRGDIAKAILSMNSASGLKVAIDWPSGTGFEPCFRADLTVTFHDVKEGMLQNDGRPIPQCGEIVVRDIGIPSDASVFVGPGDLRRYPRKPIGSKKGETGKVLIIGGGPFTGAPTLAAIACVKAGCDLVRVAVPIGVWDVVASASPDLIVEKVVTENPYRFGPEALDTLRPLIEWSHAVLIGPGAGSSDSALDLMRGAFEFAMSRGKPVVMDADALMMLGRTWYKEGPQAVKGRVLLTPHRGELRRLMDAWGVKEGLNTLDDPYERISGRTRVNEEAVRTMGRLSLLSNAALLCKGPVDLVVTLDRPSLGELVGIDMGQGKVYARQNATGVPAMSVGGTGDILSGLCAGMVARGMTLFDAACLAAFVNGRAGERTFSELGYSLSASEVLRRTDLRVP